MALAAFALLMTAVTAAALTWVATYEQEDGRSDPTTVTVTALATIVWTYAVVGSASAGTWLIDMPSVVAIVVGVGLGVAGLAVLVLAVSRLWRSREADAWQRAVAGVVVSLAGVAISGRSAYAVLLVALFALLAGLALRRQQATTRATGQPSR